MIEPQRLADLFDAHAASLTLYARQLDPGEADEHVQEAFVRLMNETQEPPNPAAWLALTLRRLTIDRKRSWFRRKRRERAASPAELFEHNCDPDLDARSAAELLVSLPERQREIVVLRIWHGLTLEAIGEVIGLARSSVHSEWTAALESLRQRMEQRCATKT